MTDYLPLLLRAVANLENNPEGRRKVYERARQALLGQLRTMNPPLSEAEITRERLALEDAIRRVDQQFNAKPAAKPAEAAATGIVPSAAAAPAPAFDKADKPEKPEKPDKPDKPSDAAPARAPAPADGGPPVEAAAASRVMREAMDNAAKLGAASSQAARSAREVFVSARSDAPGPDAVIEAEPRGGEAAGEAPPVRARARTVDFAKVEADRAMRARLLVGGIVLSLLAVAVLIGYVHRDRILASFGLGPPPPRAAASGDPATGPARVPQQETRAPAASVPAAAVAQRAVLYEENPSAPDEQLQTFVGTAVWRTETINPGPGRPPELGLRLDVEVPDRKMTVTFTMRRNPDATLPASHTIEAQFLTPGDPFGGVANLPGIRAKTTETAQGAPLVGLVVRVMPGYFLVGLSAIEADREQNLSLLRERGWLDIPFVYNNGRRAVLVIEKGTPGERAMNEAIAAWGG